MADASDVANVLCEAIGAIVYPNGTDHVSAVTTPVNIYPGWPDPAKLGQDLKPVAGYAMKWHVSVFPTPSERNTTRYHPKDLQVSQNVATYSLTKSGQVVTVGGAAPAPYRPHNLAIFVARKPYVATASAGQTPAQIAAALAALIAVDWPSTGVSGAVITMPAGVQVGPVRVGCTQTLAREVRRSEKVFQISLWTDKPENRSTLASLIDPVLSDTPFLLMLDGYAARLRYRNSVDNDNDQKQGIYRKDLFYTVEYATTRSTTAAEIVVMETNLEDADGDVLATEYE